MSYPNIVQDVQNLETKTNNLINDKVNVSDLINLIYPVGSIYMSVNNVSPQSFLGGAWEQIKDRFLLSSGDSYSAGSTGGEASHILTINEMPIHNHTFQRQQWYSADTVSNSSAGTIYSWKTTTGGSTSAGYIGQGTNNSGSSHPHNNMPPYLTVYMWKRIS